MYNKNIMRAINDVNRTCKDPDRFQAEIESIMGKYGAKTKLIKTLSNGINHYRILDQDGLEIGDYHGLEPVKQWGGYRPGAGAKPRATTPSLSKTIRFTADEWEQITTAAASQSITPSEYIRSKALS